MTTGRLESILTRLPPSFTTRQSRAEGLSPRDIAQLLAGDRILELSRGAFRKADAPETAHLDLIAVSLRSPSAVVCLESALALHDLIDDIPGSVHLAVPRGAWAPRIDYPPTKVSRFDPATFDVGIESFIASPDERVRVYSAVRSVVDAMRLRRQIGETLALHALGRFARRDGRHGLIDLINLAARFNVEGPVRTAVEAVLA